MESTKIRNFSIIAHIDHGKSTLADRMLQLTGTVSARDMREQVLDSMELEREKGVTIKASAVRMEYQHKNGSTYILNLIDTPGHVDFGYEVSRALEACEGAILVVDSSQGVEAQTLANLYLALEANLEIIPVVNKIDLPGALPEETTREISDLLGIPESEILHISAKAGTNIDSVLEAIVDRIPPPRGEFEAATRALIFDSHYDPYKGVIAYVRVVDGYLDADPLSLMAQDFQFDPMEVGYFSPGLRSIDSLSAGEVGYIATGLKSVRQCRVGDTVTQASSPASKPLQGYQQPKPMVFAGFYPIEGEEYSDLQDALAKLQLNDAALTFEPETSQALNYGFRCGFLGMFHMEIIQERLEREHDIQLIATAPSVEYQVSLKDGSSLKIDSPAALPPQGEYDEILEPWMRIQVFTPTRYYGSVMDLTTKKRGNFVSEEYPTPDRVVLEFDIPLAELIVDFYNQLKSRTQGYASLDYSFEGYRAGDLVKLEILINSEPVDAFSLIIHRDDAYRIGQKLVTQLQKLIPRQLFTVPIQAAVGGRVIARANVKALRKDVTAKCYGGDITRKRKLLSQQKRGKKRLKTVGSVEIPQDAFLSVMRIDRGD